MNNTIAMRMSQLRELMTSHGVDAYLVNGSDPHMSEYVPERWKTREFVSGFTGSFGYMAITADKALLWTDSRYFLQAAQELEGTGITMMKARLPESVSVDDWLISELDIGNVVGFDGTCYSAFEIKNLKNKLNSKGITINDQLDLLELSWEKRPELSGNKAFLHPLTWAGVSRKDKIGLIMQELEKNNADWLIISALDDLAWTFNIRGADVACNPVVLGYGLIGKGTAKLFVDATKFKSNDQNELTENGVELHGYADFYPSLTNIEGQTLLIDPNRSNYRIAKSLSERNTLIEATSFPAMLKSQKNHAEIEGMKKAHITDGLALLDFMLWLENGLGKESITEYDIALKLNEVRTKKFGYVGESFDPIVGCRDHGAIVHFTVTPENANKVEPEGILLIDSGGQYEYGTTDITRTIALGPVSAQMKSDFTRVLKGLIALSRVKYPKGTMCCHLDVLARAALWEANLNYGHGTGHGVGAFLNVHEGPNGIRPDLNSYQVRPGNIFSNEPGLYREGEYGIRIENLILCVEDTENSFGSFMRFETLTRFPIDNRLIDRSLLVPHEIEWINNYHKTVLTALSPFTNSEEFKLLKRLTETI
jgi:Xaa-Pro aminopeptidase